MLEILMLLYHMCKKAMDGWKTMCSFFDNDLFKYKEFAMGMLDPFPTAIALVPLDGYCRLCIPWLLSLIYLHSISHHSCQLRGGKAPFTSKVHSMVTIKSLVAGFTTYLTRNPSVWANIVGYFRSGLWRWGKGNSFDC